MRHPMMSVLEQNPVLPAVKDAGRLEACLAQPAGVVFLLCGDILNIDRLIDRVHQAGEIRRGPRRSGGGAGPP